MASPCAALLLAVAGCVPPFSELQSARTLGPRASELTASYSSVHLSGDDGEDLEQRHLALHAGVGLSEQVDLRFRLDHITAHEDGESSDAIYTFGAGPKFALVRDRIAFYWPVGFAFGDEIDTEESFQTHPTLIGTAPLAPGLDLTGSAKALIPIANEGDNLLAFNVGLGIGEGRSPVVLRPEIGMLINPGEDGHFWHFSVGVSWQSRRQ